MFIPSLGVSFRAESSTSPGEVDRILNRITIVANKVGVPEPLFSESNPAARFGEQYADRLTALGLKPNLETRKSPGYIPGNILAAARRQARCWRLEQRYQSRLPNPDVVQSRSWRGFSSQLTESTTLTQTPVRATGAGLRSKLSHPGHSVAEGP